MLSELKLCIQNALLSYLRYIEKAEVSVSFDAGLELSLNRMQKMTENRKRDVKMIYQLCALERKQNGMLNTPRDVIQAIFNYLETLKTGFWIFSGSSTLRDKLIQGIEQYGPYLKWVNGCLTMNDRDVVPEHGMIEDLRSEVRDLTVKLELQRRDLEDNKVVLSEYKKLLESLRDPLEELAALKRELHMTRADNLMLRQELLTQQQAPAAAVSAAVSLQSFDSGVADQNVGEIDLPGNGL